MKKILSILIAITITVSTMYIPAFATGDNIQLSSNKTEYEYGEDIIVTASGGGADAWVGIYEKDAQYGSGSTPSYYWYYVNKNSNSAKPIALQQLEANAGVRVLPAGDYQIHFFQDGGYTVIKTIEVTVKEPEGGVLPADNVQLESIIYTLDDENDGLANGTVKVTASVENTTGIDCVMYWADANGKPLEGYTALAKFKLTGKETVHEMYDYTIIPEGAKTLIAYVSQDGMLRGEPVSADLPEGCNYVIEDDYNVEFQLISDIHIREGDSNIHNTHFTQMLEDVRTYSPDSIGIFVNGDIADNGKQAQYEKLVSLYNTVKNKGGIPDLHLSIGNHDWYDGNPDKQFQKYVKLVNSSLDEQPENVYYDETVAGYHFIYLGGEQSGGNATLSADQLSWFDNRMKEITEEDADKPVFVLLHQPLYNTVAGSLPGQGWHGVNDEQKLRNVLKKYPQIIIAGGHSHWELDSEINMYPGDDNMSVAVNTASVAYLWSSYNIAGGEHADGSNGYYVRVYDDKVIFMGRDIENSRFVSSAMFVVEKNKISTPKEEYTIDINDKYADINAEFIDSSNVKYESSNPSVVSVTSDGRLAAVKNGTAEITITALATGRYVKDQKTIKVTVTGASEEPQNETFIELYKDESADTTADKYEYDPNGTSVYVRADCAESGEYYPWIGLYEGALTCDTWSRSQASIAWAYAEQADGTQKHVYNGAFAFDMLAEGNYASYQGNFDGKLHPGTYTVILFKDYDNYGPLAYRQFTVEEKPECVHDYLEEVTDPTCTEGGYTVFTCSECGDSYKGAETSAKGHTMTYHEAEAPECTISGNIEYWTCDVCSKYYLDEKGDTETTKEKIIAASNGHVAVHHEAKDSDCVSDGNIEYWTCAVCPGYFLDSSCKADTDEKSVVIPKSGHKMTHHGAKSPDCENDGNYEYWTCNTCDKYFFDEDGDTETSESGIVNASEGHDSVHHSKVNAECEKPGNIEYWTCSKCNRYYLDQKCEKEITAEAVITKKEHEYKAIVTEPTCTEGGYTEHICECGDRLPKTDITGPAGHKEVIDPASEATYFEKGLTEGSHCSVCSETIIAQEITPVIDYNVSPAKASVQLRTVSGGYNDVKFSWDKVENADGYNVYYRKASSSSYYKLTDTSGTSAVKNNLTAGAKYFFWVVPYVTNGDKVVESSEYKEYSIYTLKKLAVPRVVRKGAKVRVSWTNINGETGYQISKAKKKNGTSIVSTYKTTTGKYKNVTAKKGVRYYYKVRVYKNVKVGNKYVKVFGPWSAVKAFRR